MTLGLAILLLGALLMYAGITGRSLRALLGGDSTTPSRKPTGVKR